MTFTATVSADSPGSGTPTGTVTFMDGTTDARYRDAQLGHGQLHHVDALGRHALDHGGLQRRRQLHDQHVVGA